MPRASAGGAGGNLILASVLALLSYVPFEFVAKGALLLCAILFILDPIPPVTRLVSLVSLVVVALVSRWYREWHEHHNANVGSEIGIESESSSKDEGTASIASKKAD